MNNSQWLWNTSDESVPYCVQKRSKLLSTISASLFVMMNHLKRRLIFQGTDVGRSGILTNSETSMQGGLYCSDEIIARRNILSTADRVQLLYSAICCCRRDFLSSFPSECFEKSTIRQTYLLLLTYASLT